MNLEPFEKLVFLHFPKTAGTTLHDFLVEKFPNEHVFPKRFPNSVHGYELTALEAFKYYSAHFHMNDVSAIPSPKRIITFLREPKARILSLYYFWRSHSDEAIEKHNLEGPRRAKANGLLGFLKCEDAGIPNSIDNIYVRSLTGAPKYLDGKPYMGAPQPELAVRRSMDALRSMFFVGFQETFTQDSRRLVDMLGLEYDEEMLLSRKRDMSSVEKEPITPEIDTELDRLTRVDSILFERAKASFSK